MTLETAKQIVEERRPNKEAEAIFRGGMYICENTADGGREYVWIKVMPTNTDDESSIKTALENYRKRKRANTVIGKTVPKEKFNPISATPILTKDIEGQVHQPFFLERLKKKAEEIWGKIDSIVIE